MVNMAVPYQGPDGMSAQLLAEVKTRYGTRTQNKGFVSGYPEAARAGQTGGHFPDMHGITHAIDIGVDIELDGTGLLPADAMALAEHLRKLGAAGAHPFSRRGYLIHDMSTTTTPRPVIAGFHTGWKWVPYTGASPHSDHIHVTTGGDQQWGEAPQLQPAVYNSRASWGVAGVGITKAVATAVAGMSPVPTGTRITQEFGSHPGGYNPAGGHTGRDYGAWTGTNAAARMAGTVLWADWCHKLPGGPYGWSARWFFDLAFGGIIVVIRHDDGVISTYSHLWSTHLNPGDRVARGEFIGKTGNTGAATSGDHLHYEILPATPNYASSTYGRIHPGPYITAPYLTSTAGDTVKPSTGGTGTTIKKEWSDMASEKEIEDAAYRGARRAARENNAEAAKAAAKAVMTYRVANAGSHPVTGEPLKGFTTQENELRHAYLHALRRKTVFTTVLAIADAVRPSTLLAVLKPTTTTTQEN